MKAFYVNYAKYDRTCGRQVTECASQTNGNTQTVFFTLIAPENFLLGFQLMHHRRNFAHLPIPRRSFDFKSILQAKLRSVFLTCKFCHLLSPQPLCVYFKCPPLPKKTPTDLGVRLIIGLKIQKWWKYPRFHYQHRKSAYQILSRIVGCQNKTQKSILSLFITHLN